MLRLPSVDLSERLYSPAISRAFSSPSGAVRTRSSSTSASTRLRRKSAQVSPVSSRTPRPVESTLLPSLRAIRSARRSVPKPPGCSVRMPQSRITSSLTVLTTCQLLARFGAAFPVFTSWLSKMMWLWTHPDSLSVWVATTYGVPGANLCARSAPMAFAFCTSNGSSLSSSSRDHDCTNVMARLLRLR